MKPLVIIPVYNEEKKIGKVLKDLVKTDIFDILVIDDGSKDRSVEIARSYPVNLLVNPVNLGKGCALRKGLQYALKNNYRVIITMDGDGQHRYEDVLALYNTWLKNNDIDIVIGNRMWQPRGMPWIRRLTNKIMSKLLSHLTDTEVPDTQCGLKLMTRRILDELNLSSIKFEVESEILFQVLMKDYKVVSLNISSVYFPEIQSHIRPLRDTLRFLRFIFKAIISKI